jgi:hypothetical protein
MKDFQPGGAVGRFPTYSAFSDAPAGPIRLRTMQLSRTAAFIRCANNRDVSLITGMYLAPCRPAG